MEQQDIRGTDLQPGQSHRLMHQAFHTGCCALLYLQRELYPAQAPAAVKQAGWSSGDPSGSLRIRTAKSDNKAEHDPFGGGVLGHSSTWGTTATAPLREPCCRSRTSMPSSRTAPPCTEHAHEHLPSVNGYLCSTSPEAGAQRGPLQAGRRLEVHLDIVQADQQPEERGLPGATGAHDCAALPRLHLQADPLQHRPARLVSAAQQGD